MRLATLLTACLSFAAGSDPAQDAMKKDEMMKKEMTAQECKDHMATAIRDDMKKDDMSMKKDTLCADMMKKDGMMKEDDARMKKDGMAEPMKK